MPRIPNILKYVSTAKVKEDKNFAHTVCSSQKGAMFGLDSRIALAIFGTITVIAGAIAAVNTNVVSGQSFSKELRGMQDAINGIHRDMQRGLHSTLITNTSANAFQALYDDSVISATYRNNWVGPYIERASSTHPKFGTMLIERLMADHTTACGSPCYLWLTYSSVDYKLVIAVNDVIDGEGESNPDTSGLIQWTGAGPHKLWYNVSRAIN
jgi:hypothetical protein